MPVQPLLHSQPPADGAVESLPSFSIESSSVRLYGADTPRRGTVG